MYKWEKRCLILSTVTVLFRIIRNQQQRKGRTKKVTGIETVSFKTEFKLGTTVILGLLDLAFNNWAKCRTKRLQGQSIKL